MHFFLSPSSNALRYLATVSLCAAALGAGALSGAAPLFAQTDPGTQEERDARFAALLDGARLEGKFNLNSASGESPAQADLYSVSELKKGEDGTWIFEYTMSYGQGPDGPKQTIPIPVRVEWAGDTPVLTMTEQTLDGLGTFTVRVMIYGERYAGTWQNGAVGGHMWGRIVRDP